MKYSQLPSNRDMVNRWIQKGELAGEGKVRVHYSFGTTIMQAEMSDTLAHPNPLILIFFFQITCPGVWLCSSGKVSLQVHMLDSSVQTRSCKPVFPLQCYEKFIFSKTFYSERRLNELQRSLSKKFTNSYFLIRAQLYTRICVVKIQVLNFKELFW